MTYEEARELCLEAVPEWHVVPRGPDQAVDLENVHPSLKDLFATRSSIFIADFATLELGPLDEHGWVIGQDADYDILVVHPTSGHFWIQEPPEEQELITLVPPRAVIVSEYESVFHWIVERWIDVF